VASAALDVSDGLVGDLRHVLERSNVGAIVDLALVPRSAALASKLGGAQRELALSCLLAGGDDYELCFCAPPAVRGRIDAIASSLGLPLTRIGAITARGGLVVRDERATPLAALPQAFDHFRA
jgi:thiamine-monophosphate kinase